MSRTPTRLTRLACRWAEGDRDEQDRLFVSIERAVMRMPVVRATKRRTWQRVAGQNPRFAQDEEQAIRRAIWRALKKFDPDRGVDFDAYVSRGVKMALGSFWREEAWRSDLCINIPALKWRESRKGRERSIDKIGEDVFDLCANAAYTIGFDDMTEHDMMRFDLFAPSVEEEIDYDDLI